jgi:undecaprenyl-diphosphatase
MAIPLGDAATLGALRGVTEILPLSGSGHEELAEALFGGHRDLALGAVLDAAVAVAIVWYMPRRARAAVEEGLRGLARPSLLGETPAGRDALFVAIASVVTLLVAFVADRVLAGSPYAASPYLAGVGLLVSAAAVASIRLAPAGNATPSWTSAVLLGVAQGTAVVPGVSRTGVTIAALVWMGTSQARACELSLLAAIPAWLGAALVVGARAKLAGQSVVALAAAALVTVACASLATRVLRAVAGAEKLHWFAIYLGPLALATIAWEYARP